MAEEVGKTDVVGIAPAHDEESIDGIEKVNASGHVQELDRNFSLLSVCAVGIVTGNTWAAFGGSIVVSIYNGGPPGVIYEFIAVSIFYWLIAASIAELASAIPSAAGVYHWASITGGRRHGLICGWFAGWWNFFAWIFGCASMSSIVGNQTVQMYATFHPDFVPHKWHVFVSYLIVTWLCCCCVLFANRALPAVNTLGLVFILAGVFITVIVCAVMPSGNGKGYASNDFVWRDWENGTGWGSNGFVFVAGMLNGAFAVGTPDCVSHLAEEIPNPSLNVPKAIAAQMGVGFITAFAYLVAIFYSISDVSAVLSSSSTFPLAEVYHQATGSRGGTLGLILLIFLPTFVTCIGTYLTAGRMLWTLARDDVTPFARFLGAISPQFKNPFNATLVCGCVCTVLGCIYVGSATAFQAFVDSYVVLSSLSYFSALLPHLLSRRANIRHHGAFWMKGAVGYVVNAVSCAYIAVFAVIYCFPYSLPVSAQNMNYSCLITGGLTLFVGAWWAWKGRSYVGPRAVVDSWALESAGGAIVGVDVGGESAAGKLEKKGRQGEKEDLVLSEKAA
ncbi:MAG: hypothetical protein M1819_005675 [Sarea resinae]|nr:MAG: hypothetical protein M1819_005675 [Sarea resinae]